MSECVYFDILQAVGVEVAAVDDDLTVSVRSRPLQLDAVDPVKNHVLIWPGEGSEFLAPDSPRQWGTPGGPAMATWVYPVVVVFITAGNRVVAADLLAYLTMRQLIRNAIFHPLLSGTASVYNTQIEPQAVFDETAFTKGNFDVTGWQMYYSSSESILVTNLG